MNKEEILQQCVVEGLVVKLPDVKLDRKLYQEVAKALELIGGKWKGNKVMGFVFNEDPTELLEQIANGESRNLKKEFQFFATPDDLADYLVELADLKENDWVLEPSAGQGAIIKAINRKFPELEVDYFELMDVNRTFLNKIPTAISMFGKDFLVDVGKNNSTGWNKIIGNPPFSKNSDISHVLKMYEVLSEGGRLVSLMSTHWEFSMEKKCVDFRIWLNKVNATILPIEKGVFKNSGTNIATNIVLINKL
jgi:hypothetical protein